MASISTLQASSSSSSRNSYEVFLSFRGEDTRKNFTDHLYNTLVAYGIRTFRDDEQLQKGDDIKSALSTAIQDSKIFLIIFSENYATSKWCLNELVKIIECTTAADDQDNRSVIPVFYHVQPSDVGHQSGCFEDAFLNHEKDADQEKKELIGKWRIALEKAAKLSGYHVDNQYEAKIIQKIREVIITRLNRKPLYVGDNIVGMDFHLEQLKSMMKTERDDAYMVGIYGIGGIGKTTMAMAIYNDISSQFDGSSFLRVDGETSSRGLLELQRKLLRDTLKGQSVAIQDHSEGINEIKGRLCSKRVLIILDDVDEIEQLNSLAGKDGWYGAKSIVIITTKDISLLNQHGVDQFYQVEELNHKEAIELFNWWAFKRNIPKSKDFECLSDCVVKYAKGLPLALKVLGGFLYDKSIDEWKSALKKLEKIPHMKVQNILQVSYDKLDDVEQEIFLDIACFFRGKDRDFVSRILGSDADIVIRVLQQRCLITISENNLNMHDLLQQMGKEIVRQQCPKEPGKRSRLWDHIDVQSVLTRNTGTETIEGLFIEVSAVLQIQFSRDSFTRMNRLRLLKVNVRFNFKVDLPMDFELSSFELRYLHFSKYPLKSLPKNFHANNLVELNLTGSNIRQLWKENEVLNNLRVINLSDSKDLIEMPNFASVPNLEILDLSGCTSLESLPRNFHKLKHLISLDCSWCSKLKSFPQIKGNMSTLREIDLSGTAILEVPSRIEHLNELEYFNVSRCKNLASLPENICNLRYLETLIVGSCYNLKGFPDLNVNMENLKILDLRGTAIKELPSSIGHLKAFQRLDLSYCKNLVNLPESICDLRSLDYLGVQRCSKLERLEVKLISKDRCHIDCVILKPGVIWSNRCFSSLKTLNLQCDQIEAEASNHHILPLSSLMELSIRNSLYREGGISSGGSHFSLLELLSVGNFNPMARRMLSDNFCGSSLRRLSLHNCNLMEEGVLKNIRNLSSLVGLSLSNCNLREGDIVDYIFHLSSLEELSLEGNHFSNIPASISRLSNLKGLNLSQCKQLKDIPELPSSLLFLDAHYSDGISSSSSLLSLHFLFNRFKSKLTQGTKSISAGASWSWGMSIVIPKSSTVLEMIRNRSMGSNEVTIKLPQNWYENKDLLGFALCCVYVPRSLDNGSGSKSKDDQGALAFQCRLFTVPRNNQSPIKRFSFNYRCDFWDDNDDSVSDQMWVIYYPKNDIKEYLCSQWTHITASFYGCRTLEVEECGINLIYASCFECQRHEEWQPKLCFKNREINELPLTFPNEVGGLCFRDCENLETLPSTIFELKSLTTLSCSGCSGLKSFPEIPPQGLENLRKLHLDGTAIQELPSSIHSLNGLQYLNLAYCNNLLSLPETICQLKSLVFLSCLGCSQLMNFPEIGEDMENLRVLYLDDTAIEELPTSIQCLRGLEVLQLSNCSNLLNLPDSICNLRFLKHLNVNLCSKLDKLPHNLGSLQCLEFLGISGFDSNNVQGGNRSDVCCMSSCEASNLSINYFSSIIQLSKLRILDLSHSQKLLQIPELPPSVRILDVHACPCLETSPSPSGFLGFSLFECFKSEIKEFESGSYWSKTIQVFMPGYGGIPEWISHQEEGSQITKVFPRDWYQNSDFLGFALYCVHIPCHLFHLKCTLNFRGHPFKFGPMDDLSITQSYSCCHINGGESNRMWVAYYPKVAIDKKYWSNEWRRLKASFYGGVKVKECGFHLIYSEGHQQNQDDDEDNMLLNLLENFGDINRSTTVEAKRKRDDEEHNQAEEPHPKRSTEPNTDLKL